MADLSIVRTALTPFIQKQTAKRVKSTLYNVMPLLELFAGLTGTGKKAADGLGRPDSGNLSIGRVNEASRPMREKLFAAREYLPIIQTTKPAKSETKNMADYDNDPTVPLWDTDNRPMHRFKQPNFRFSRKKMAYKIPHSEVRTAIAGSGSSENQAAKAVGSVYDVEVKNRTASLCEYLNDELFAVNGQPGVPTDESSITWDHIHGLQSALGTTNTYGGIDRSVSTNAFWRANKHTTNFTGTFEDMIEHSNYTLGLIDKGLGVQIIAVGNTLMRRAKAEARALGYQMVSHNVPDPEYGFKREMVKIFSGNRAVFVVYDPAMNAVDTASGTKNAFCLDPSTWTIAIPGERNFKVTKPKDGTDTEGGDEADFGTIEFEWMVVCEVPAANAWYTDIAA